MAKKRSTKYLRIVLAAVIAGVLLLGFYHQNNPVNTLFRSIGLVEAPVSDTSDSRIVVINVGPVSYTHLDVYKRQPLSFSTLP